MQLVELIDGISVPVYVNNEERRLLEKLRGGEKKDKLTLREREIVLRSLIIKGLVNE
jgi:hypothetical protein